MKTTLICLLTVLLVFSSCRSGGQTADENKPTKIAPDGESVLNGKIGGKTIRVVVRTYKIDIGTPSKPLPGRNNTNCTYSRYPCSQVSSLGIALDGKKLFVPRSVFADCADVGTMTLTNSKVANVLTLTGGDASEGYTLKVFFDAHRINKRELYADEANALVETTTYLPPAVLK